MVTDGDKRQREPVNPPLITPVTAFHLYLNIQACCYCGCGCFNWTLGFGILVSCRPHGERVVSAVTSKQKGPGFKSRSVPARTSLIAKLSLDESEWFVFGVKNANCFSQKLKSTLKMDDSDHTSFHGGLN